MVSKQVWTAAMRKHRQDLARMLRLTLMKVYGDCCNWCKHEMRPVAAAFLRGTSQKDEPCCTETDHDLYQFAHVHGKETELKGSSRGQYYRLKDVFDHPDCYVLLCKNHHLEYDKNK